MRFILRIKGLAPLAVLGCCLGAPAASSADEQPSIAFNRDILPILSNNCFACHGPDAPARKAGLRLDLEEAAKRPLASGGIPIVPGDAGESLILQRITATKEGDRMPPPDTGKVLTEAEKTLLARWITEGAEWQPHWAFIPPERPVVPGVGDASWTRNPIDNFVLKRLETEGLSPSAVAGRATLIRRASLALTGLPPSPDDIKRFVQDTDPNAYGRLVEGLLASPRYGEHMARYWLDIARYADTNGYAADIERTMWRYRDWVINAFNANMPFDQFSLEQLAGDFLPAPTLEQRIATGFNRNHPIMMEGGAIFEEYRVNNVVDRVNTTATTWLGLTLSCAQCHDHKYDPISQREFYAFYAFFNNVTEEESRLFGTEVDGNSVPRIKAPLPEQQAAIARLDQALAEVRAEKLAPVPELGRLQQDWEKQERLANEARWTPLDVAVIPTPDDTPVNANSVTLRGEAGLRGLTALRVEVSPAVNGEAAPIGLAELTLYGVSADGPEGATPIPIVESESLTGDIAQAHDGNENTVWKPEGGAHPVHGIFAAPEPFAARGPTPLRIVLHGDGIGNHVNRLRFHVSTDPGFLPAKLEAWHVSGPYPETDGESARETRHIDPTSIDLDAIVTSGEARWRNPPDGLSDGKPHTLHGGSGAYYFTRNISSPTQRPMDLRLDNRNAVQLWVNGRLVLDKAAQRGEVGPHPTPVTIGLQAGDNRVLLKTVAYYDFNSPTFFFEKKGEEVAPLPLSVEQALLRSPEERSQPDRERLRGFYRSRHWETWPSLDEHELDLAWQREKLIEAIPTTMVMEEMDKPRPAHILVRGEYDQPGEAVAPGVPDALHSWPGDMPPNRLGLARWLVAPDNPLTARVTVNRLWQQLFGEGLVRTPDDFGVQGARPTHPALIDWLANEFVDSGWDVQALQRLMVTSATFRQQSHVRADLARRDPDNRLLARGPRFRLDAEVVRDTALAASGLLVAQLGGPSVKPYQPPGLWKDVAYGGGGQRYTAQEYVQDHGDDLYRRSLYTFWKRAAAPPGMLLFDAPNRDVCTAKRSRSNTPLQALVLMNDTQFVEAARGVAQRVLNEAGPDIADRVAHAGLLVLGRLPRAAEKAALVQQYNEQLADYRQNPEGAEALLDVGESGYERALDPVELAAWTMVANSLLNTDAAVSQY